MHLPKAHTTVPPTHNISAPYVGVGDYPSFADIKRRQIFVGPAGKELDEAFAAANISRPLVYLTNVIKDRDKPVSAYIQLYKNNKRLTEPIISERGLEYLKFLSWELAQTDAEYFLAIGAVALWALTGRLGINNWRGSIIDCTLVPGRKVLPILHPSTLVPPNNQYFNKRLIIFDLKRLKEHSDGLYIPTERVMTIAPSFLQVIEFLSFCKEKGLSGSRISYDIEVFMNRKYKQVSCISFAVQHQSICIAFTDNQGDYFTITQEAEIWKKIAELLEHPNIRICGQNLCFDNHFLLRIYGIRTVNIDDTMVAQNQIMPDYPKGLDFITSIWTDHPYYKADGKAFFTGGGAYEKFWKYNAMDSHICDEAFPKQLEEIIKLNTVETYFRQIKIIEPLVYMMEKGLKVNTVRMEETSREYAKKIEKLQMDLNELAGKPLNAASSKQLKQYFFFDKGIKPYRKGGKITYNNDAMKRLARKGWQEASIIQKIRKHIKIRSTYLDIGKIDDDGRIRCSYNPAGTRYSRISSSKNIWGTGGNLQNWPHNIQEFLIPDEGYVYYAFDLGQAENRIVAYVGEVIDMIECFETRKDVHSKTARMIMKTYYSSEKKANSISVRELSPLGDGTHEWRFWGKKANHGFNYDWGYRNFALANELPENDGKLIYNSYHNLYPGVQQAYHTYVKSCLRSTRILINLMGRRTVFLGPVIGEKAINTYKEAYSCIPQGTVGDIINENLNYIYYNQDKFKPVELLRQVHDEIGFQIPISIGWDAHAKILYQIKKKLEKPLTTHNGRSFIIPADLYLGKTMNKDNKKTGRDISKFDNLAMKLKTLWRDITDAE